MNRKATIALSFSILAAISTASAQAPAPGTQAPAAGARAGTPGASPPPAPAPAATPPRLEMKPSVRVNREAPVTSDARGCLEFPSNNEIIRCAEKYLPHKRTG